MLERKRREVQSQRQEAMLRLPGLIGFLAVTRVVPMPSVGEIVVDGIGTVVFGALIGCAICVLAIVAAPFIFLIWVASCVFDR